MFRNQVLIFLYKSAKFSAYVLQISLQLVVAIALAAYMLQQQV
jgi:hypothetical protein